jgi:hypothetical protein
MGAIRRFTLTTLAGALSALAVALLAGGFAASASALDDISIGAGDSAGAGACPALTQIKYPFLSCTPNAYGGVTLSMPGQPAPLECHLRAVSGECAADPSPWGLGIHVGPPDPES